MKYARSGQERIQATRRARGNCPACDAEMIARCGPKRVNHWAHKGRQHCDHWWEPETRWHRKWKNEFPIGWQETVHKDENGERHIADLTTPSWLVIEFQHSPIKLQEIKKRTSFYKRIIWVIDGTRRKKDENRFSYNWGPITSERSVKDIEVLAKRAPYHGLLAEWAWIDQTIVFDFNQWKEPEREAQKNLWIIHSHQHKNAKLAYQISRAEFVSFILLDQTVPNFSYTNGPAKLDWPDRPIG